MPDPQNNFLIFNEANNSLITMSDEDYASYYYRTSGLIPMEADYKLHNKMFRQWSIMSKAIADMIGDKGYDALDSDLTDLKNNLKSAVKDLARDELQSDINGKANSSHTHLKSDITDITASTTEINYLSGAESNIQQQINAITGVMSSPFPTWNASTPYDVGDICIASNFKSYQYLECLVAGTTDSTMPNNANVGQMVTDNEVKWLVCDWRDSAPVGAFRSDMIQRAGWLKANGATVNRADYPRLWAYAVDNSLTTNNQTNNPGLFGTGNGSTTFSLPNFEDYFIRYSYVRGVGSKQASQMAQHNHSCGNQDTSHTHTLGNQSANHQHTIYNNTTSHNHKINQYCYVGGTGGTILTGSSGYKLIQHTDPQYVDNTSITHTHTMGNQDTSHTHSIGNQSANHKHSIGNTGSGSNTYPDNITMQMYIKY